MSYLDLRDLAKELDDLETRDLNANDLDEDEQARFAELKKLQDQVGGDLHTAANNEPALIPDSEFEEYTRELCEDIHGKALREAGFPFNHIDWASAAKELQSDYTDIEFDGETYWWRGQ